MITVVKRLIYTRRSKWNTRGNSLLFLVHLFTHCMTLLTLARLFRVCYHPFTKLRCESHFWRRKNVGWSLFVLYDASWWGWDCWHQTGRLSEAGAVAPKHKQLVADTGEIHGGRFCSKINKCNSNRLYVLFYGTLLFCIAPRTFTVTFQTIFLRTKPNFRLNFYTHYKNGLAKFYKRKRKFSEKFYSDKFLAKLHNISSRKFTNFSVVLG